MTTTVLINDETDVIVKEIEVSDELFLKLKTAAIENKVTVEEFVLNALLIMWREVKSAGGSKPSAAARLTIESFSTLR